MLFNATILEGILRGDVIMAFRRWRRPTVSTGGTLRTPAGVLAIDRVDEIGVDDISEADARHAGMSSRAALLATLRGEGPLYRITFHRAGDDPRIALREDIELDANDLAEIGRRLDQLDRRASFAWTQTTLALIAAHEGMTAAEIAVRLGMDKAALKQKTRKLKELGLTQSLVSGYRISTRGRRVVDFLSTR